MGGWLLFAPPETGFMAGWVAAVAYGISNASPFWLMIWLGPAIKAALGGGSRGFTVVDFIRERYGRSLQAIVSAASLFFMLIFMAAELTSIGGILSSISDGFHPLAAIIPVSVVTLIYTINGGVVTSISTDRVQGVVALALGLTVLILVSLSVVPELPVGSFAEASKASITGLNVAIVLWTSTTLNQFLDQGMWQRVFAAKSKLDAQLGLFIGGLLTIPTVASFGYLGIVTNAAKIGGMITVKDYYEESAGALFLLLRRLSPVWLSLVALLGVVLVSSTVDSLQTGLMGLIGSELLVDARRSVIYAKVGCVIINIIATVIASFQFSVLSLLLISNIVSCSIVPMLGLAFHQSVSPLAASIGVASGLLTIMISGWVATKTFLGGFIWFSLPDGPSSHTTAITFIATPAVTTAATLLAGYIHCWISPSVRQHQCEALARMKIATTTKTETQKSESSATPESCSSVEATTE